MAYEAGTAVLEIVPSFLNIESMLAKGARDIAKGLDKALGNQLGDAMDKAGERAERTSERAGRKLGQVFAERALRQVETALGNIPESDRVLKPLRVELEALAAIDLGKGFDERDFIRRLEKVQDALKRAQQDAQGINAVGRFVNAGNAAEALGTARQMIDAARRRGFEAGDAWVNAFQSRLRQMRTALPDLKIRQGASDDERQAAAIRSRIQAVQALNVGDVASRENNPLNLPIGVKISREDLAREMSIIEGLLDNFIERFQDSDLILPVDKARQQVGAFFEDIKTQQQKAAEDLAREQARADEQNRKLNLARTRRELEERAKALRQAREQELRDEQKAADDLADYRARLIERELDERQQLAERNRRLSLESLRREVADRAKALRAERDQYQRDYEAAQQENIRRTAELLRGTTAGRAQQGVRDAASSIQHLPIRFQTRDIDREMAAIRERIAALGDITIGVHTSSEEFADDVEREFRRLKQIARDQDVRIQVRADAAKAATELGGILVLLNRIDKDKATVKVDTSGAIAGFAEMLGNLSLTLGRLGALIAVGASIGTAIVPAAAAAASTIGAIGTAALAAGSGIGVMILGFSGIGDAVSALDKAADAQQKTNVSLGRSASQVAAAQDQIKSAEMALANTRRNNAQAALRAQRAIRDALEDQRDTVRDVARANQDAAEKYADAQRAASRADLDAQRAQLALTEAYRAAQRAIEDLNSSIRGNALDQRQATLDIAKAKQELDKVLLNPRATEAEIEQARINYEQRKLQMDDLKRKGLEMANEQEKRFTVGIKGSQEVKRAEEAIAEANERSADAQRSVRRAAEDVDRQRVTGQERLRDAQQKVADAQRAAVDQQADAAYSLFTANQSLIAAQRALANAYDRSGVAGGAALDNVRSAMGKLSPTAQQFAQYIFGLRGAFFALRQAADPMLAGVQRAMQNLIGATSQDAIRNLQPLFDFVSRVATALGGIFVRFSNTLKGPTFARFFTYISSTAVPTLNNLYTAFENLTIGFLNLFLAFTPLSGDVENGFVGMTESFRKWSETLQTNQGFQEFLGYLRESGPQVMALLRSMLETVGKLVVAAAPVGTVVVKAFTWLFEMINKIPEDVLISLVAGISAAATAIAIFAGVTAAMTLGIPGLIAGAIAAIVIGFSVLVGSSQGLRDALVTAWEAIKTGLQAAWEFIWPILQQLGQVIVGLWQAAMPTLKKIGEGFVWLWQNAILPAAQGIWEVILQLWDTIKPVFETIMAIIVPVAKVFWWLVKNVIVPVVAGIVYALVKVLTPVIKFLWNFIFKPILKSLGLAFSIAGAVIKVAIGVIMIALKALGALFGWIYDKAIRPAWEAIRDKVFKPMGEWISKNIKPHWDKAIAALGKAWAGLKKLIGQPIKFVVETLLNDGLLKGYNWLADKFNVEPKNVRIPAPKGGWTGFAAGGAVYGPGTATSDSIPARLSRGEHVLTAREVRAAGGHDVIYALRQAILKGRLPGGYAAGGAVGGHRPGTGDGFGDWLKKIGKSVKEKATDAFQSVGNFLRDPLGSIKALAKVLLDKVPGKDTWFVQRLISVPKKVIGALEDKVTGLFSGGGQDGAGNGVAGNSNTLGGSAGMIGILRAIFPGLNLNSGFRPGSITVTGNRSYHASNRAIDVPPRRDVFEWIRANYPNSRELIFSPMGSRQIWNGRPHVYTGSVRNTHYDHVHWAYDKGGLLPDTRNMPGSVMQVFHGRRTPDKVLTDAQWQSMAVLAGKARESMRGGDTYNFPYRDTTLDKDELDRFFARRDALARVGRDNF